MKYSILSGVLLFVLTFSNMANAAKCLYVSSYHQGYEWSDGIEKGIKDTLKNKCVYKQFDMDTKRNKSELYKKTAALKVKALIASWQPDVVIVSDDNASKYVVKPFYKNHTIPFVFCGINWNVDAYGYPYNNVTGIVEVAPIKALFDKVTEIKGKPKTAYYLGANTLTEKKNLQRFVVEAKAENVTLYHGLANSAKQWRTMYKQAQNYDFIIMGSNAGIENWEKNKSINFINKTTKQLSVTNHQWMMFYTVLGLTKIPEEQGIWAAQAALAILDGIKPSDLPIVSNRTWDIWVNETLIGVLPFQLPKKLISKAKKISFNGKK